jgi:hypothetical protein
MKKASGKTKPSPIETRLSRLAEIAADLTDGKSFSITRLTTIKRLCEDDAAARAFAPYIAGLAQGMCPARSARSASPRAWGRSATAYTDVRDCGDLEGLSFNLQVLYWIESSGGKLFRTIDAIRIDNLRDTGSPVGECASWRAKNPCA